MSVANENLRRYAFDTFSAIETMVDGQTGIPANRIRISSEGEVSKASDTTPSDIGLYISSLVVARDMGIVSQADIFQRASRILTMLESFEKPQNLFLNWYDISSGEPTKIHHSGGEVRPFLSTIDNAILAASLMMLRGAIPELVQQADALLNAMDYPQLYDQEKNLYWGGIYPNQNSPTSHHYDVLGSEIRLSYYVGIAQFGVESRSYEELCRRKQKNGNVIQSWGGSMFEAMLPSLYVPESQWSKEWKSSHTAYIRRQIYSGIRNLGFWGTSPCDDPDGVYREYGQGGLGIKHYERSTVITPHAAFLAMPMHPRLSRAYLEKIENRIPGIYRDRTGFFESFDASTGRVSNSHLMFDDGMIVLSAGKSMGRGVDRYSTPQFEKSIKPILENI